MPVLSRPASLLAVVLAAVACDAGAPVPGTPSSRTAAHADVSITVELQADRVAPGQGVGIRVTVGNRGRSSILFRGSGCTLPAPRVEAAAEPPTGAVPRSLAAFHAAVTAGLDDPAGVVRADSDEAGAAGSCTVDHGFAELLPGGTLQYAGSWPSTTALGAPATPARYGVRATFRPLRPGLPLVPADYRTERDSVPVEVEAPLTVVRPDGRTVGLSASEALGRMLAHLELARAAGRPGAAAGARLTYDAGSWLLRLHLPDGAALAARLGDDEHSIVTVEVENATHP